MTILTSPHIEIHEQTMLLPIKTCYNIQISSKSLINQASARAALTQIINTVLQRLEQSFARREQERLNDLITERQQQQQQTHKQHTLKNVISTNGNCNRKSSNVDESHSLNGSTSSSINANTNNQLANCDNGDHYREMYMHVLRHFECEQLHSNGVRSESISIGDVINNNTNYPTRSDQPMLEVEYHENDALVISELMCNMLEAICDDECVQDDMLGLNGIGASGGSEIGDISQELSFKSDDTNITASMSVSTMNKLGEKKIASGDIVAVTTTNVTKPATAARDPELVGKENILHN